ncbi:hypothetical protein [Halostella litorea]|uniref:hypothetical protein n=1 Tax=Halostella litorea TaxID=2528831 RepID=UPI001091E553|nr:hypothetical protein [Halostella litorea]
MHRRTLLAATGVALGTAVGGCLSGSDSDDSTDDPTDDAAGPTDDTAETTGDPDTTEHTDTTTDGSGGVVVEDVVVKKAVTYTSIMGSGGVLVGPDRQYVVATVRADEKPSASEFAFEADGESWEPGLPDTEGAINYAVEGHEGGPVSRSFEDGTSFLAFTVPSPLSASDARIRYTGDGGGEWALSADALDRLAAAGPRFELDDLTVPGEVSQGEPLSVSLTVTNVSETDGRFLAAAYWPTKTIADDDESHVVEREMAAGESVAAMVDIDTAYTTDEDEPVTLSLRGHVTADREVQVRDASGPE